MNIKNHFSITFNLAYPVILSQLGQVMVGVADSMMVGQLGALPLAAASLANSIFFVLMMFGMGVSMGITPLISIAEGKGKALRIGKLFRHGLWINIFCRTDPYRDHFGTINWPIFLGPAGGSSQSSCSLPMGNYSFPISFHDFSDFQAVCRRPKPNPSGDVCDYFFQSGQCLS